MKKFSLPMIIAIILTFGFTEKSNAQKQSKGLYLTDNDYANHKLSYTGDAISIHEFLGGGNVTVISNGQKQEFEKSKIFGYKDDDGKDYRFYDNRSYQIVDATEFFLYSYDKLIQQGKGPKPTKVYYFSKNSGTEVLALTPENIAIAFPDNAKFRYLVEVAYKSAMNLYAYDNLTHQYEIKEMYTASLK